MHNNLQEYIINKKAKISSTFYAFTASEILSVKNAQMFIESNYKFKEKMKMKNSLVKLAIGSFAVLMVLVLADLSYAQPRKARGKVYTKAEVEQVIKRVETRTDNFVDNFDESLDDSNLDGTEREDDLMDKVRRLENETDDLKNQFDRSDGWVENKPQVRKVLNLATDIDKVVKRRKLGKETESNWARLKYELNTLAKIYKLPTVGSSSYK